jgi:hypothetical protein
MFKPCPSGTLAVAGRAAGSVGMPHAQAHPLPPCRTYALRWARRSDRRESDPRPDEAQRHPDAGECKNPAARTSGFFYSGRHHNPGRSGARQTTALARLWRPHCGTRRPFINHLPFNPVLQEDNERFFARICRDHETRSQTAVCERREARSHRLGARLCTRFQGRRAEQLSANQGAQNGGLPAPVRGGGIGRTVGPA